MFFIIGAQRCGTTYLYKQLDAHPEIFMAKPITPEPKFFIREDSVSLGKQYYFDKYFKGLKEEKKIGEKSTSYIEYPESGKRIMSIFDKAKFIIVLRNPVKRAVSNFFFSKKNGLETRTIKETFIDSDEDLHYYSNTSVSPYSYLKRGIYLPFIKKYSKIVGQEKIKIILFEELIQNEKYLQEVYKFLDVNENFSTPNFSTKVNQAEEIEFVPNNVIEKLKDYFETHNKLLANEYDLKLNLWNL